MSKFFRLIDEYKQRLESFLSDCDAVGKSGAWDRDEYGDMDTYYTGELVGLCARMIAGDEAIEEDDCEFMTRAFGFEYSPEEVDELYASCRFWDADTEVELRDSIRELTAISPMLSDDYRKLVSLSAEILLESGRKSEEELNLVKQIYEITVEEGAAR